ncbi:MAG: hypothetical protein NXI32_17735 [bacterium]|nr:hypothetical protein [bacterium]
MRQRHRGSRVKVRSNRRIDVSPFQGFSMGDALPTQGGALRLRRDTLPWAGLLLALRAVWGGMRTSSSA